MRAATRAWLDAIAAHGERVGLSSGAAHAGSDRFLALYLGFELMHGLSARSDGSESESAMLDLTDVVFVSDRRDVITTRG